ncbi:hypothetical protein HDU98_008701 [Podochytrium sp. JEL0797]|nr:hypothetical protein HDU98_008701 [Podochytrium sp. JEL0797]
MPPGETPPSTAPFKPRTPTEWNSYDTVYLLSKEPTANLPTAILPRIHTLLKQVPSLTSVQTCGTTAALDRSLHSLTPHSNVLIISLGTNTVTSAIISEPRKSLLKFEEFVLQTGVYGNDPRKTMVAIEASDQLLDPDFIHPCPARKPKTWCHGNRGLAYGAYHVLEMLGFAFLHPLEPTIPPALRRIHVPEEQFESPRWRFRGIHYHTQHPLELTPFFQGFGPSSLIGENLGTDTDGWIDCLPEWELFCEWLVANKQNAVEWALLEGHAWLDFARSPLRQSRLRQIVSIGHTYGITIGVDVPIAFAQQHSFRLLRLPAINRGKNLCAEFAEIEASIDWVMAAGFDFMGTENGTSEFTHTDPTLQLKYIDAAANYLAERYNASMYIKAHCSTGQVAKGFKDPRTGKDMNYNFLPHFASTNCGVLPHTVETYALDDPAPTYGNTDFGYIRDYLNFERESGKREVVFYPETAYWVSVDIDVPLFLPIYADRRLHDLRLLANDEDASPSRRKMDGQLIFTTGWEWSYWLNDVVAARSAWNPYKELDDQQALRASFEPVTRHIRDPAMRGQAEQVLVDWCNVERELLIYGRLEGQKEYPKDTFRRNGHAYLLGWDTWDDVSKLLGKLTQPDRLGLIELKRGQKWSSRLTHLWKNAPNPDNFYLFTVKPLLEEMDAKFEELAARTALVASFCPTYLKGVWSEMADTGLMTSLRANQMKNLYAFAHATKLHKELDIPIASMVRQDKAYAQAAMIALRRAQEIVNEREKLYRVPADRISSWTNLNTSNPTAYAFNYLWTTRSLYFWWRDAAKAFLRNWSSNSPSFANIIDPIEVGLGSGKLLDASQEMAEMFSKIGFAQGFFDLSDVEPKFPESIKGWEEP